MTSEIQTINKATEVAEKNRYMTPRKARIYTQSVFDNTLPGMVGLSIFIEAENDGKKFSVGKTKAVEDRILPKIRLNLDKFGQEFTASAMENTSESSFKSLLNQMLENVLETTPGNEED